MRLTEDKTPIRIGKSPQAAAFSADGGLFASAAGDGLVKVWDAGSRQLRTSLPLPILGASVLAFSADGTILAAACPDKPAKQVRILAWDLATGQQRASFTGLPDVSALAFSPDGTRLAVGGAGAKHAPDVLLWDLASRRRKCFHRRRSHKETNGTALLRWRSRPTAACWRSADGTAWCG